MLKVTLIEFILRGIPESILFFWAIHLLTQTPIKYKKLLLLSVINSILTFVIRLLPINLGINSFISLILIIYLSIKVIKIPSRQAISITILTFIIEFFCEMLNMIGLQLLKFDVTKLFQNPLNKILYALPSLVLFIIFLLIIHYIQKNNFSRVKRDSI